MSIANYLVNLTDGLTSQGVLGSSKGGTGLTTVGSSGQAIVSDGTNWVSQTVASGAPKVSQISYTGDNTAANPTGGETVTLTGTGFAAGARVLINQTQVGVVTVVSATQITFTAPALATGSYVLYVVNLDGGTAVVVPGIQYSGVPSWTTAAGTLGTVYETAAISSTVAATSDSAVSYSVISGALPTGATLASNGTISGTSPVTASSTTYTFTVRANDAENQETDRTFNLTINPDVVTWSSPANSATLVATPGVAYSSALSAASAAGQTVSYSANALPAGLAISGSTITGTPTTAGTSSTTLTATSAVTNRSAQVTISWTITVAADAYFPQTTLLLNSETTAVPFLADASTNNFSLTVAGDTKPNNFNPYTPGYYSIYLATNSDYYTYSDTTSGNFGTGDFTVEGWFNLTATAHNLLMPTSNTSTWGFLTYGDQFYWQENGGNIGGVGYGTVPKNQWVHLAASRTGGFLNLYINGTRVLNSANTYNYSGTPTRQIGTMGPVWFSNVRIIKGTGIYSGTTITVPTSPLTAVTNTSLLTCQSNRMIDNSANAVTFTRVGSPAVQSFSPFTPNSNYATYGSTYLNGTTDYLTVPQNAAFNFGTGDFTVEGWWNFTSIATSQGLISLGTGANGGGPYNGWWFDYESSGILRFYRYAGGSEIYSSFSVTLVPGTWYHIACTRSGTNVKMFVNGVQVGTTATSSTSFDNVNSDPLVIGRFITGQGTFYLNGYVSDVRITKGTAVYTTAFTPPAAPLTAVSGTSLLTCQGNQPINNQTFLDNSSGALPITYVGSATQGSFAPYGANWSNYFDGNCSLNPTTNSGFTWGTGNYTIEMWYNPSVSYAAGNTYLFDQSNNGTRVQIYNNYVRFFFNNGATELAASTAGLGLTVGTWYHLAIVRNSGVITMYINGTSCATANSSADETSTSMKIGNYGGSGYGFTGYISNFRTVKGVAVYTTAFTPPTAPLTAVTGTSLLTCQSPGFTDNSLNSSALTAAATLSTQKFSPFATVTQTPLTYSTYFDGTGDYLTLPSSSLYALGSVFTVELWIYPTNTTNMITLGNFQLGWANSTYWGIATPTVSWDVTSTTMPTQSAWNHVAVVRTGTGTNQTTIYLNGVSVAVGTFTQTLTTAVTPYIGSYVDGASALNGYISNLRIVKGTAVYTANFTPATTPLTAVSGTSLLTCQSATLVDNSINAATITAFGDAKPRRQNPFGYTTSSVQDYSPAIFGSSVYSDNTATLYNNTASPISGTTVDWTMEAWCYFNAFTTNVWVMGLGNNTGGNTPYLDLRVSSTLVQIEESSTVSGIWAASGSYSFTTGQWYHLAATRSGSTIRVFVNGTQMGTTTYASAIQANMKPFSQGLLFSSGAARTDGVNGYVSDARMVAGTALYTANFVPPTAPLQAIKGTSYLINGDKAAIQDKSGKTNLQTIGDAKISTAVKKYGNSSMYFDGTGDCLSIPNNPVFNFGTGDFTVEAWIYLPTVTNVGIIGFGSGGFFVQINTSTNIHVSQANVVDLGDFTISPAILANTWYHLAMTRSGTSMRAFINGIQQGSTLTNSTNFTATNATIVGGHPGPIILYSGYMDDLRVTRGYARYTTNFTPPSSALITK